MENDISAIIFDMNGVIIDDETIHEKAFSEVLQPFNITLSHEDYKRFFLGRSDMAGFELLNQKYKLPISLDDIAKKKMERYWQFVNLGIPSVSGAVDAIKILSKSYLLALTTGATKVEVNAVFAQFQLADYFEAVISVEDFTQSKPHPEPYLVTAESLHVPNKECVVIEDAPAGIQSAKKAGMRCIAITTTHDRQELNLADLIIDSFSEITIPLINSIII